MRIQAGYGNPKEPLFMRSQPSRTREEVLEILRETLQGLRFCPDPDVDPRTRALFKLALDRRIALLEAESAEARRLLNGTGYLI